MILQKSGSFCLEIPANLLVPVALTQAAGKKHYFQSVKKRSIFISLKIWEKHITKWHRFYVSIIEYKVQNVSNPIVINSKVNPSINSHCRMSRYPQLYFSAVLQRHHLQMITLKNRKWVTLTNVLHFFCFIFVLHLVVFRVYTWLEEHEMPQIEPCWQGKHHIPLFLFSTNFLHFNNHYSDSHNNKIYPSCRKAAWSLFLVKKKKKRHQVWSNSTEGRELVLQAGSIEPGVSPEYSQV